MLKAVLRKGVVVPVEPLPSEWEEGTALEVAKAAAQTVDIHAWAKSMAALCADSLQIVAPSATAVGVKCLPSTNGSLNGTLAITCAGEPRGHR